MGFLRMVVDVVAQGQVEVQSLEPGGVGYLDAGNRL